MREITIGELTAQEEYSKSEVKALNQIVDWFSSVISQSKLNLFQKLEILPSIYDIKKVNYEGTLNFINKTKGIGWLTFMLGSEPIYAAIELDFLHFVIDKFLGKEKYENNILPLSRGECGILFYILHKFVAQFRSLLALKLQLIDVDNLPFPLPSTGSFYKLYLKLEADLTVGNLWIFLPKTLLYSIGIVKRREFFFRREWLEVISVYLPLIIGYTFVDENILKEIEEGDILTLDYYRLQFREDEGKISGEIILRFGEHLFLGTICKDELNLYIKVIGEVSGKMEDKIDNFIKEEIGELDIRLDVVMGEVKLKLKEIDEMLREGKIIPLGIDFPPVVKLMHEKNLLAIGQLVSIEGELGFKVLKCYMGER